jgi:hypothetical protein
MVVVPLSTLPHVQFRLSADAPWLPYSYYYFIATLSVPEEFRSSKINFTASHYPAAAVVHPLFFRRYSFASSLLRSDFRAVGQKRGPNNRAIEPSTCRKCSFVSRPWRSGYRAASQHPVATDEHPLCRTYSFASRPRRSCFRRSFASPPMLPGFRAACRYPVVAVVIYQMQFCLSVVALRRPRSQPEKRAQ